MDVVFVERKAAGFYIAGSRVPLDCIVHEYWQGESPEGIHQHYPTLTLEQVHGAIEFYLDNRVEVDALVAERRKREEAFGSAHPLPTALRARLNQARQAVNRE